MMNYHALPPNAAATNGGKLDGLVKSDEDVLDKEKDGKSVARPWRAILTFSGLILTTTSSTVLLIAHAKNYKTHGALASITKDHQASTQLVIQVLANIFAIIQTSVLCELVNVMIRIRLCTHTFTISALHFWISVAQARLDWNVRPIRLGPLACFVALTAAPAAIWAGAIAPVSAAAVIDGYTTVAAYTNTSLIQEYDNTPSPEVQSPLGLFTYALGDRYPGQLLESARSANTPDGSVWNHSKLDNTQYVYTGRSYGMAGSAGLVTNDTWPENTASYTYSDIGYNAFVSCIYNRSASAVTLIPLSNTEGIYLYTAEGYLPNSNLSLSPEYMTYVGMNNDKKVIAFSSARKPFGSPERILAIAAGQLYNNLDMTQCTIDFRPATFNISVALHTRNIVVTPVLQPGPAADMEASGNLTYVLVRQIGQIPKNVQGWDFSLVGQSLNTSIANYRSTHSDMHRLVSPRANTTDFSTLRGLEVALTAVVDDMLASYASAQIMVANHSHRVPANLYVPAIGFGQPVYNYAVFAFNISILLLVATQAYWTSLWHDLPIFDCLDPGSMIVAASGGGTGVSKSVEMLCEAQVSVILGQRRPDKLVLATVGTL